jgi:FkbM family methyltransferase
MLELELIPTLNTGLKGFDLIESGEVVLRLPDFRGTFTLNARSHLTRRILSSGSFEPECAAALVARVDRNRDAIDVGANAGFYSVLLAQLLGPERRVVAVEPTGAALARLNANLERNQVNNKVDVHFCALGAAEGEAELEVHEDHEEYSSFASVHPSTHGIPKRGIRTRVRPLDRIVQETQIEPGFIKIDVEGAEFGVLCGAEQTLRQHRPHILLELVPSLLEAQGTSLLQVKNFLAKLDYRLENITEAEALAIPG